MNRLKKQHYLSINLYILERSLYLYNIEYGYFNRIINKWIVPKLNDITSLILELIKEIINNA